MQLYHPDAPADDDPAAEVARLRRERDEYRLRSAAAEARLAGVDGDPSPAGPWPQVCFLHVGKTAGSAVFDLLRRRFGPARTFHVGADEFDRMGGGEADRFDLVTGHFSYRHLRFFRPNRVLFSFVREPVARAQSAYWFLRTWDGEVTDSNREAVAAARRYSLLDFLRHDHPQVVAGVWNPQAYTFAWDRRAPRIGNDEAVLDAALAHLDNFLVVGLTERADEALGRLFRALRWEPPPPLGRVNVTPGRPPLAALTKAERDAIGERTELDAVLYQAVRQRVEAVAGPAPVPSLRLVA
ncbi:MAG: sulfotransferase family protein [Gemmataceae bacterium]|nr:sulfotransferase family protein [Gemmataceae bacterium]